MARCREGCVWFWGAFTSAVFEYDTAKIVHIKNKKVGFMNRLIQVAIVGYIIIWGIIIEEGYQRTGPVLSTVTTKLKGASLYNGSHEFMQNCKASERNWTVYDIADYVVPPQEPDGFFVMTNMWVTCGQTQDICPEDPDVLGARCTHDDNCTEGKTFEGGNGPAAGSCHIPAGDNGTCNIYGWCPVEQENETFSDLGPKINATIFTVLLKNTIQFPTIRPGDTKRNVLPTSDATYLKNCTFDPHSYSGRYCPIIPLGQIVDMIHPKQNFTRLSTYGGVVGLQIAWNCDHLEFNLNHCHPKYSTRRLDDPEAKISAGYNFRYAKYYYVGEVQYRTLIKAYGIWFKVEVIGQGGRFDFLTLFIKLGSMIALLGIATVVSDILVLYVLKLRHYYRTKKYLDVVDPGTVDAGEYEVIEPSGLVENERQQEKRPINPGNAQSYE